MTDVRDVALLGLKSGLAIQLHPYVDVEARPKSTGYLVSWTGEPTVDDMRRVVAEVIDDMGLPLDRPTPPTSGRNSTSRRWPPKPCACTPAA